MKRLFSLLLVIVCALALCPNLQAQACANWNNWKLAGTYSMSGSGFVDLSKLNPALPAGMVPYTFVGVADKDGTGNSSGFVYLNFGGMVVRAEITNGKQQVNADCTVQDTFTITIKDLGLSLPGTRIFVITPGRDSLVLEGIMVGTGPGTILHRITMKRIDSGV